MNLRIRVKHDKTFQERLNEQAKAKRLREDFAKTPSDSYRELLLRRASKEPRDADERQGLAMSTALEAESLVFSALEPHNLTWG